MTERVYLVADFNVETLARYLANTAMPGAEVQAAPFGQVRQTLSTTGPGSDWNAVVWTRAEATIDTFRQAANFEPIDADRALAEVNAFAESLKRFSRHVRYVFVPTWTLPWWSRGYGMLEFRRDIGLAHLLSRMNLALADALADEPAIFVLDAQRWFAAAGSARGVAQALVRRQDAVRSGRIRAGRRRSSRSAQRAGRASAAPDHPRPRRRALGRHRRRGRLGGHHARRTRRRGRGVRRLSARAEGADASRHSARDREQERRGRGARGLRSPPGDGAAARRLRGVAHQLVGQGDRTSPTCCARSNLGAESAVFIDDSAGRARARARPPCPASRPEWPEDPTRYREALSALRCFDTPQLTAEDRQRSRMYAAERTSAADADGHRRSRRVAPIARHHGERRAVDRRQPCAGHPTAQQNQSVQHDDAAARTAGAAAMGVAAGQSAADVPGRRSLRRFRTHGHRRAGVRGRARPGSPTFS